MAAPITKWTQSLCGCFGDCCSCLLAFCIPLGACCVAAKGVEKSVGDGCCTACILQCLLLCVGGALNRQRVRDRLQIPGNLCVDCLLMLFCMPCASTQMYREGQTRGRH